MNVIKASGTSEPYSRDKLITSCMNSGASLAQAAKIERKIRRILFDGIPTKKIRDIIHGELYSVKPSVARRYMGRTGLRVRTSKIIVESFNKKRIVDSLISETKLDSDLAKGVASEVEKELVKLKLDYVTAPLIREVVNVKLLEHGLENTRARYTRLGMPVHDVHDLIDSGFKHTNGRQFNPEAVHKLMGDQISREYTLINVLPLSLSDSHMKAELNIHDLDYFATRSHSFSHDLRFFLKNGFKPDGTGKYTAISGPPKKAEVAFLHAGRILAAAQTNCSGGQGLNYFNTFMAPYIRGLSKDKVKQLAQMFVFELSQMYGMRGGQVVYSSIDCDIEIPHFLRDVPAVLPKGRISGGLTYGDFTQESEQLLSTLCDIYLAGDYHKKPFIFPKFNVRITKKQVSKQSEIVEKLCQVAAKTRTPYFITSRKFSPKILCLQGSSFIMPSDDSMLVDLARPGTLRGGVAQLISINLPHIAYEANGKESVMRELLYNRMLKAKNILLLKKKILEKNLKNNLLPFMSQKVARNDLTYLNPEKQAYVIGFVGLNEMVSTAVGSELHESKSAQKFGLRFIQKMKRISDEFNAESGLFFTIARTSAEAASIRFPDVDSKRFQNSIVVKKYTNSFQVRPNARISSKKRIEVESPFHKIVNGGALSNIYLNRRSLSSEFIESRLKDIIRSSNLSYYHFTMK